MKNPSTITAGGALPYVCAAQLARELGISRGRFLRIIRFVLDSNPYAVSIIRSGSRTLYNRYEVSKLLDIRFSDVTVDMRT